MQYGILQALHISFVLFCFPAFVQLPHLFFFAFLLLCSWTSVQAIFFFSCFLKYIQSLVSVVSYLQQQGKWKELQKCLNAFTDCDIWMNRARSVLAIQSWLEPRCYIGAYNICNRICNTTNAVAFTSLSSFAEILSWSSSCSLSEGNWESSESSGSYSEKESDLIPPYWKGLLVLQKFRMYYTV